jgi:hypothetical protein
MRSSRLALRAPATLTRSTRARTARVAAAPGACAKSDVPRVCGMNRPERPCRSGTLVPATRARSAAASAGWSSRRTAVGTARPARLGRSGTTLAARGCGRSRCLPRWSPDVAPLSKHRGDPEVRNRALPPVSANPRQPWQSATRVEHGFRPFSVHQFHIDRLSGTTTVHSGLPRFAGISCPFVSVRERP